MSMFVNYRNFHMAYNLFFNTIIIISISKHLYHKDEKKSFCYCYLITQGMLLLHIICSSCLSKTTKKNFT